MNLENIYTPIQKELLSVEEKLAQMTKGNSPQGLSNQRITDCFFKMKGKRFRPALTLFAAGIVSTRLLPDDKEKVICLAASFELLHSASLIHDDIIDGDMQRRGERTLNSRFGNKVAVLAGDIVFSKAFSGFSSILPSEHVQEMTKLTERMCGSEITQIENRRPSREIYFDIIRGKTAGFMAACCGLGAMLGGGTESEILMLREYGLNFGIAYQLVDDILDGDSDPSLNITIKDAEMFAGRAIDAINTFQPTPYYMGMVNLMQFILDYAGTNRIKNII